MANQKEDTICAIATPAGNGAIAVIRLNGPEALLIAEKIFSGSTRGKKIKQLPGNTIHHGYIKDNGRVIDEVLLALFRSPRSYTGEDMVEISCHGSLYIQQSILQLLIRNGARMARPGEFTQRAFLNGKMDLSQAEAVADLIASSSEAAHRVAINQIRGGFSEEIGNLRKQLLKFISLIELELDFSEENVEFADRQALRKLLSGIQRQISMLIQSFGTGNVLKDGIPVVIAGLPNAGKSTLLNVFLNEERAIVSEMPGTTRDTVEDQIHIEGYLFRFIDTAGLRHTEDKIEMIGIRKTYEKLKHASIVLLITDAAEPADEMINQVQALGLDNKQKIILLLNKIDKTDTAAVVEKARAAAGQLGIEVIGISAKQGIHIDQVKRALVNSVQQEIQSETGIVVTNARHYDALQRAYAASERALTGIGSGLPGDLLAQDIREIMHYLGEITGEITTDEILGNIFANFCIGK